MFAEHYLSDSSQEKGEYQSQDESKDNRSLVDNNMAQSLTGEDIDEMRRLVMLFYLFNEGIVSFNKLYLIFIKVVRRCAVIFFCFY